MEILILTALAVIVIAIAAWSDKESEYDAMDIFYGVKPETLSNEEIMEYIKMDALRK